MIQIPAWNGHLPRAVTALLIAGMEDVTATQGQAGIVQEEYVNIVVIIILPATEDMTSMIISSAITMMSIGMIQTITDRINIRSVILIIAGLGVPIIVQEEMSTKVEPVMTRDVPAVPVIVIKTRRRN